VDDERITSSYSIDFATQVKTTYLGNFEEEYDAVKKTYKKTHYLQGAILIQNYAADGTTLTSEQFYSTISDFQGSLIALVDEQGEVAERYAFDPWGARRNADDWTQTDERTSWITNRGYTGHEHIDVFGVINMNGRVYDPMTAAFFSPDPFVQSAGDWMNYNRYSYCMNNPFRYTDPSGYSWLSNNWKSVVTIAASMVVGAAVFAIGMATGGVGFGIAAAMLGGFAGGATGGAVGTALNGGNFSQCLGAGLQGAMIGAWGGAAGGAVAGLVGASAGGGFIGGAIVGAAGGAVGGFVSGALGAWANAGNFEDGMEAAFKGAGMGALVGAALGGIRGGISAVAKHGNFWNGEGMTHEILLKSMHFKGDPGIEGPPVKYSENGLETFNDKYLSNFDQRAVDGVTIETPKGFERASDGSFTRKATWFSAEQKGVGGVTVNHANGLSTIHMSEASFSSSAKLYLGLGHEIIHAQLSYYPDASHKNITLQENVAYRWTYAQQNAWGLKYYGAPDPSYSYQQNNYFKFNSNQIRKTTPW
jgi:RHS repeat-associated protein